MSRHVDDDEVIKRLVYLQKLDHGVGRHVRIEMETVGLAAQEAKAAFVSARECLRRDFVYIIYTTCRLDQIAMWRQIEVAAQTGKLQVEIDDRYPLIGDGQPVCYVRREQGCARSALAVDKHMQTAALASIFFGQLVKNLVDMRQQLPTIQRQGEVVSCAGPHRNTNRLGILAGTEYYERGPLVRRHIGKRLKFIIGLNITKQQQVRHDPLISQNVGIPVRDNSNLCVAPGMIR